MPQQSKQKQNTLFYSKSPEWTNITPIPSIDESKIGDPNAGPALATIAYSPRYSEAMSYLRAVMAVNEFSQRALALTEDIISMNPAHYTVWLFRMRTLRSLWGLDLGGGEVKRGSGREAIEGVKKELEWLDGVSEKNLKNYQIWHHRQSLISLLPTLPTTEIHFLTHILSFDSKNYHVWSYRQWLCRHFPDPLLTTGIELECIEDLLQEDVRNNSAWNHRYFIVFGHEELNHIERNGGNRVDFFTDEKIPVNQDTVEREVQYTQNQIVLAPQNPSPWNYLRGVLKRGRVSIVSVRDFCEGFVRPVSHGAGIVGEMSNATDTLGDVSMGESSQEIDFWSDHVRSSHAIDFLAAMYEELGDLKHAERALDSLAKKWDPIRRKYWEFRIREMKSKTRSGG